MKFSPILIVLSLFISGLPAVAVAADNATAGQNLTPVSVTLTPVSVSQNATISLPAPGLNLTPLGTFENASVYVSGGANATFVGDAIRVDIGPADWMEFRDVYLFYRLPSGFSSFSFRYDLAVGEKSNVLLVDFADSLPAKFNVKKGGIPDTAVLGMGTWTNTYSWIKGMNDIGGLKAFPQGAHRIEVIPGGGMVYLKVDGNTTAFNDFNSSKKYLLVHLMVGDENSDMHGSLGDLKYEGPALSDGGGAPDDGVKGFIIPNASLNGNGSAAVGAVDLSAGKEKTPGSTASSTAPPAVGLNLWLALAAAAGFFVAWLVVYTKYLKR